MPTKSRITSMSLVATVLVIGGTAANAQQSGSGPNNAYAEVALEGTAPVATGDGNIQLVSGCRTCPSGGYGMGWCRVGGGVFTGEPLLSRNRRTSRWLINLLHGTGNCGTGTPVAGKYNMTYSVNPYHNDYRNSRLYGAQGYGAPVSVPLAPNVQHTYQYGWGIPSSRLVPISHPMPPTSHYGYPASR